MKYLSQRDPKWAAVKIGGTSLTIGRVGCTITDISMLSDYFGGYRDPAWIASQPWFTPEALIIWAKINLPTMKFVARHYKRDDAVIRDAIRDPDKAVILQVADGSHWVLATNVYGSGYHAVDPLVNPAMKIDVISRYKNITGFAVFARK